MSKQQSDPIQTFVLASCILVSLGTVCAASQLGETDRRAVDHIQRTISTAEWLGPLAPVALSPFFGLTCLSGLALFGENFIFLDNALLQANTPLKSHAIFWTFLVLTVLTSVPRFSKVSKPLTQLTDQLETYASIITLIAIRLLANSVGPAEAEPVVYAAGVFSFTAETLLTIAMAINVIVINTVKFFFEMLIWVTPIPLLDACFELASKTTCAGLMAIYAFSPLLATGLNLVLFVLCSLVFRWVYRRKVYYRTILVDLLFSWFSADCGKPKDPSLVVFPNDRLGPFAVKARCLFTATDDGWQLTQLRWLRPPLEMRFSREETSPTIRPGLITNDLVIDSDVLTFSRRYNNDLEELAVFLGVDCKPTESTLGTV